MTNYDPPYETLFFVCYSAVAATVATEAGLLSRSDSYAANQSYDAVAFGQEWQLLTEEEHPWCGFGRMDNVELGYMVPDGDDGIRLINEDEYQKLIAAGLEKG